MTTRRAIAIVLTVLALTLGSGAIGWSLGYMAGYEVQEARVEYYRDAWYEQLQLTDALMEMIAYE